MNARNWNQSSRSARDRRALVGTLKVTLRDFRTSNDILFRVASDLYESLNTPVSLKCEILLRYGEIEQLVRSSVTPKDYNDPFRFADDYQAVSFLKKAPLLIDGVDPEAAAKKKFLEAEGACRESNMRIRRLQSAPETVSGPILKVISTAVGKILECLGPRPDSREWLYACRFGPGVFNHPRSKGLTSLYDKLQVRPSVSKEAAGVAALLVTSQPQWARSITDSEEEGFWPIIQESDFEIVPGNRVAFVPKTAVTHRAIAIEPLMNIYAQLGLGTLMRRKLQRRGINLNDQSANQRAALKGSIDGSLATIDLSSASDTVGKELVRLLLPDGWFNYLDCLRSKVGWFEEKWLRYEKFSSMGNGYTFELETLIFWGLMHGVCEALGLSTDEVLVYGDDIVIPVAAYGLAKEVLEFCGFSFNEQKSFNEGVFRESCGKDYFGGTDVRPFFQKEVPNEIHHLFRLANGIRMLAHRRNNLIGCDSRLRKPWHTVLRAIPRSIAEHCRIPPHGGDSDGIKSNWDECQRSPLIVSNKDGWEGISGLRYQSTPLEGAKPGNWLGVVASQLYRLGDGGTFDRKMRGEFEGSGLNLNRYIHQWLNSIEDSVSGSPRQERGSVYQLRQGAFYGPWTDFGPWY